MARVRTATGALDAPDFERALTTASLIGRKSPPALVSQLFGTVALSVLFFVAVSAVFGRIYHLHYQGLVGSQAEGLSVFGYMIVSPDVTILSAGLTAVLTLGLVNAGVFRDWLSAGVPRIAGIVGVTAGMVGMLGIIASAGLINDHSGWIPFGFRGLGLTALVVMSGIGAVVAINMYHRERGGMAAMADVDMDDDTLEGLSERIEYIRWEVATSRESIARSRLVLNVLGILLVFGIYLGLIVNVKSMATFDANQVTAPPPATAVFHLPQ